MWVARRQAGQLACQWGSRTVRRALRGACRLPPYHPLLLCAGTQSTQAKPGATPPVAQQSSPSSVLAFGTGGSGGATDATAGASPAAASPGGAVAAPPTPGVDASLPAVAEQAMLEATAAYTQGDYARAVHMCRAVSGRGERCLRHPPSGCSRGRTSVMAQPARATVPSCFPPACQLPPAQTTAVRSVCRAGLHC